LLFIKPISPAVHLLCKIVGPCSCYIIRSVGTDTFTSIQQNQFTRGIKQLQ